MTTKDGGVSEQGDNLQTREGTGNKCENSSEESSPGRGMSVHKGISQGSRGSRQLGPKTHLCPQIVFSLWRKTIASISQEQQNHTARSLRCEHLYKANRPLRIRAHIGHHFTLGGGRRCCAFAFPIRQWGRLGASDDQRAIPPWGNGTPHGCPGRWQLLY